MNHFRIFRISALVLSSGLFFPVSCTMSLFAGTHLIANQDARDAHRNDIPHPNAYLVATVPGASKPFEAFPLSRLDEFKNKNPQASFLLPTSSGEFPTGPRSATVSFVATPSQQGTQIVEVSLHDETGTFFRYEASRHTIKPIYTKLWYHGYMFRAFPYALVIAIALYFIGVRMRRKILSSNNQRDIPD